MFWMENDRFSPLKYRRPRRARATHTFLFLGLGVVLGLEDCYERQVLPHVTRSRNSDFVDIDLVFSLGLPLGRGCVYILYLSRDVSIPASRFR
jgi:hypothetical protein